VCVHTHTKKKKKEGRIYTRFENGSSSIGIKKSSREREREEEIKQASNRWTSVNVFENEYLSLVLVRNHLIDSDNKINQWKEEDEEE
jgi:hypothetical protein